MRRWLSCLMLIGWPALAAAQTWEAVRAEGARCAVGGSWHFWVHRGAPDKVLLYLQGGGGCWEKSHCDVKDQPTFDPTVSDSTENPAIADGILKLDHPANPFQGWTVVFVPYCTADVHLGARHPISPALPRRPIVLRRKAKTTKNSTALCLPTWSDRKRAIQQR